MNCNPKRLLILSGFFEPDLVGGAEVSSASIARHFFAEGYEAIVIRSRAGTTLKNSYWIPGIGQVMISPSWRPYKLGTVSNGLKKFLWHVSDHFDIAAFFYVLFVCLKHRPKAVFVHTTQGLGPLALAAIKLTGTRTIQFLHDYGVVCVNRGIFRGGEECKSQCKLCFLSMKWQQLLAPRDIYYISPSRYLLEKVNNISNGIFSPGFVVPNPNIYETFPRKRELSGGIKLLFVGRLEVEKGLRELLSVLSCLSEEWHFTLEVIGDGSLRNAVTDFSKRSQRIRYLGPKSQSEVMQAISSAHVLICPSIWPENYPGVVVQALSSGVPVIGSKSGGIPELVEHRVNGLLFDAHDSSSLRSNIVEFLSDASLRAKLDIGAELFSKSYSVEKSVGALSAIALGGGVR